MTKGTVIYVGNFELPDKNAAAHRVVNNGKIFRALGYRVVYLGVVRDEIFSGVRRSSYDVNVFEEAYPVGVKAWVGHIFDTSNIRAVFDLYDDVRFIILYNAPFATVKAVKKAFSGSDVTVAYDCTEWNPIADGALVKRLYKKRDEKQIRNKLCRVCNDVIVISKTMEKQYSGANLLRLPPLVDTEESIWAQKREDHGTSFEFCFAAGSVANKERPDAVVDAFCRLAEPEATLRVVGVTKEEFEKFCPDSARRAKENGKVTFFGLVSHQEAVRFVLSCDCYVFVREKTLRNEAGFPTKFTEAYTCGVPVITTDVSDVAAYVESQEKGAIVGGIGAKEVCAAMRKVLSQPRKEKKLDDSFDFRKYVCETEKWISRAEK